MNDNENIDIEDIRYRLETGRYVSKEEALYYLADLNHLPLEHMEAKLCFMRGDDFLYSSDILDE